MAPTKTEKPKASPEMVKIDGLDQLKQELDIGFDTKNDKFFEGKDVHLEISRAELDKLHTELLGMPGDTEKLERIKKIIQEKEQTKIDTGKEVGFLRSNIESFPRTSEGMEKAFELIKDNKEPQKYLIISQILNVFVYKNGFSIKKGDFLENISIVDKDGKEQKEYTEVINKYVTKDVLKNVFIFEATRKGGNFETRALEIANKYQINLKNGNKAEIRTQILSNSDIEKEEQMILLSYIDGDYKQVELVANNYVNENNKNIKDNQNELQSATGIEFTKEKTADYARNPDKLVGDVVKEISKNPLLLFSTIGLILGKIFGFKVGKDGSFLMNLLATGAGVGAYKALGVGKHFGDLIEGKAGARDVYSDMYRDGKEGISEAIKWSGGIISKIPGKISGSIDELTDRISFWYDFSNVQITENGASVDLIDSNFNILYNQVKNGNIVGLKTKDGKEVDDRVKKEIIAKINEYKTDGIAKFGEKKFEQEIKGKSMAQVIDLLTDKKAVGSSVQQNNAGDNGNSQSNQIPAPAKPKTVDEILGGPKSVPAKPAPAPQLSRSASKPKTIDEILG